MKIYVPRYSEAKSKNWNCRAGDNIVHEGKPYPYFCLTGHDHGYMDTTHFEYRTHAPHFDAAHGNVLNCGLGMGFAMYNFARKPEVKKVVTVEIDAELVNLFPSFCDYETWPVKVKRKCRIVNQSALEKVEGFAPDYIFVDIGKMCLGVEPETMEKAKAISALYPGVPISVWTQEKVPHRKDFPLCTIKSPDSYNIRIPSNRNT